MRIFNRVLVVALLLAVIVFAGFSAGYAFAGQDGYSAANLPTFLAMQEAAGPVQQWLANFEAQSIAWWLLAILVVVGLAGIALLAFELLPRRSRYLTISRRLHVERGVIEEEAERVASADQAVLASSARLFPRRHNSKLAVRLKVRRGEDIQQAEARVGDAIAAAIVDKGQLRIARAKVKASTRDPRGSKRRVR